MTAQELLARISDYCRQTGLAESTFGRRAVNDGKLANRLRNGGRITTETVDRIQAFMDANRTAGAFRLYHGGPRSESLAAPDGAPAAPSNLGTARFPGATTVPSAAVGSASSVVARHFAAQPTLQDPQRNFRFFDNRQKYLLFVNTCSEKWVVAHRLGRGLVNTHPPPRAVRLFAAGIGDGTVLARVMRAMHDRFPAMPFYVVGKEISLEDTRLTLQKVPDRFVEHP